MDRYNRQADIVPIHDDAITIIGVGAIGRQAAIQLTAIGTQKLRFIDFDSVEETNIVTQGYTEQDLGQLKVVATRDFCQKINSNAQIMPIAERFRRTSEVGDYVFCCVDSIVTRKLIWESIVERLKENKIKAFIDARMSAEVLRVITASKSIPDSIENYEKTLFTAEEAHSGACTAKATIYCANIAAGFMLSSFTKCLRGIPTESDFVLNLLTNELVIQ